MLVIEPAMRIERSGPSIGNNPFIEKVLPHANIHNYLSHKRTPPYYYEKVTRASLIIVGGALAQGLVTVTRVAIP